MEFKDIRCTNVNSEAGRFFGDALDRENNTGKQAFRLKTRYFGRTHVYDYHAGRSQMHGLQGLSGT
jgi:hypothetical protein